MYQCVYSSSFFSTFGGFSVVPIFELIGYYARYFRCSSKRIQEYK